VVFLGPGFDLEGHHLVHTFVVVVLSLLSSFLMLLLVLLLWLSSLLLFENDLANANVLMLMTTFTTVGKPQPS